MNFQSVRLAGGILVGCLLVTIPARAATETVVYFFKTGTDTSDGYQPNAGLIEVAGTFYGTTFAGGAYGVGTVFSVTPQGNEMVLHSFGGSDGANPSAGLIYVGDKLYGTTSNGGARGFGTVFSITTAGTEKIVYSFKGRDKSDGDDPVAGLIDVGGTLYGTTLQGGTAGDGTVFSWTKASGEKVVYSFKGASNHDGANPYGSLISAGGTLYGTTGVGGTIGTGCSGSGCGTVFSVTPSGAEKVVYTFQGASDGYFPQAGLINIEGMLYGTTEYGGGATSCRNGAGCGTVFSVTAKGKEKEKVLHSFLGGSTDGAYPEAGVIDMGGTLYGTTYGGGGTTCQDDSGGGCGTVFAVTPAGAESVVYVFPSAIDPDGVNPVASLINMGVTLYGTCQQGGSFTNAGLGAGTVFSLTP